MSNGGQLLKSTCAQFIISSLEPVMSAKKRWGPASTYSGLNWQASGQRGSFAELIDPVELEVESLGLEFWSQDVVFEGLDKVFGHAIQEVDRSHIKDFGLATIIVVRKGPSLNVKFAKKHTRPSK
jgi:hypothetical protein